MADDAGVTDPRGLRCSDVDRERVAEALREAAGEGRLTLGELEERLDAAFKARTYGDLEPITRDLPQGPYPVPGVRRQARPRPMPPSAAAPAAPGAPGTPGAPRTPGALTAPAQRITSVLASEKRRGRWEVPPRLDVTCILGDVSLDFTEAIVRHREIVVQAAVVLGTVTLIVPEGIDVRLDPGANLLGTRQQRLAGPVTPGGPLYMVRGFVILGELTIRPPKHRRSLFTPH